MAATRARPPPALQHRSVCGCRSSSASPAPAALPSYPSAGWSRGPSLGSAATTDWPRISRQPWPRPQPWSTSPRSSSSPDALQELEIRRRFLGWAVTLCSCLRCWRQAVLAVGLDQLLSDGEPHQGADDILLRVAVGKSGDD